MPTTPQKVHLNIDDATLTEWVDENIPAILRQYPGLSTPTKRRHPYTTGEDDSLAGRWSPLDENGMAEWRGKIGSPTDPTPRWTASLGVRVDGHEDGTSTLEMMNSQPGGASLDAAVDQVFKEAVFRFRKVEQQLEPEPAQQQPEAEPEPKASGPSGRPEGPTPETLELMGMVKLVKAQNPDLKKNGDVALAINATLNTNYNERQIRHARETIGKLARN